MTIRRVSVFFALLIFAAFAVSGQTLSWGGPSPSQQLPSAGCAANGNPATNTCIVSTNSTYAVQLVVQPPLSGTTTYKVATGSLPSGLNLSTSGLLTTTPPIASGQYNVTFQATNGTTTVVTPVTYNISVPGGVLAVAQNNLPTNAIAGASVGTSWYTATATGGVQYTDGTSGYRWTLAQGSSVDGLTINNTSGLISGTPLSAGQFNITIQATDSTGAPATFQTILNVSAPSGFAVTTTSLPNGGTGIAYSQTLTQSGGPSTGVVWAITSGALPPGLTIASNTNSTATISGSPTSPGAYSFTVQASYISSGTTFTANQALSITVTQTRTLALPAPTPVFGTIGQNLTMQFSATGGTVPYRYSVLSGVLPANMQLNTATGVVSGTPTQIGTSTFVIQVSDNGSLTASATGTITVTTKLTMANPPAVSGTLNLPVSMQFSAGGGTSPYTYLLQSGVLPPGLVLNQQTGQVTGTATQVGAFTFTVQASDSSSPAQTATATGTITISTPLTMASPPSVTMTVGQPSGAANSLQFTAAGGTAPYTYSLQGTLPTGVTLNPQGLISGTPTQTGNYGFSVLAIDSGGLQVTAQGSISVILASISSITITPSGALTAATQVPVTVTLPAGIGQQITGTLAVQFIRSFDGQPSREVQFTNGAQFVNFTVPANTTTIPLPAGFALITGTATGSGQMAVSFRDSLGNNITSPTVQPVIFSIAGTAPVISSFKISLPSASGIYTATVNGYSSTLSMTNAVFTFTATSGTNLASSTITVPLSNAFANWYGTSQSNQYGGQFSLTVPFAFTVSGGVSTNPIAAASVTLTNSVGSSTSKSANPQ